MADEHDTPLTAEQDEEVRRLLGEARHDEPMPPDVVARMDRVLDDLAEEPSRRAPVVQLAARRRRAASLLVAAAAVVVVGIGVGQVVDMSGDDGQADSGAVSADSADEDAGGSALRQEREGGDSAPSAAAPGDGRHLVVQGKSFVVDPKELSRDLRKVQEYTAGASANAARQDDATLADLAGCKAGGLGDGTYVSIRYGDQPGILVLRPVEGDTQVADVYLCGSRDPVRSLTLQLPPP